jgi:hypothetical protein
MSPQEIIFELELEDESLDLKLSEIDASTEEKELFRLGATWMLAEINKRIKSKLPKENPLKHIREEDVQTND